MKSLIPWLCVVALLGGAAFLYLANQKKDAELTALRAATQEVEQLRAQVAEAKNAQVSNDEISRLRKDNEDLLRLRNEVRQLRDEKKQLAQQAQSAQAEVQRAQTQVQNAQSQIQALRTNAPVLTPEQQVAAVRFAKMQDNACINNLRMMDGAKQQWALENKMPATAAPTAEQIVVYFKEGVFPTCPAGGKYVLNKVGEVPTCSIPGHSLPQ
jgi:seryl-tRNA synthetase